MCLRFSDYHVNKKFTECNGSALCGYTNTRNLLDYDYDLQIANMELASLGNTTKITRLFFWKLVEYKVTTN